MIVGIDEAGRGPAVGPLVLCGVAIRAEDEPLLTRLGVSDSKAFGSDERGRRRRAELARQIRGVAAYVALAVAEAEEIDVWTSDNGLNRLEQTLATRVIEQLASSARADTVSDAPRPDAPFRRIVADGHRLFTPLVAAYPMLEALNRADKEVLAVAAASIIAKSERDRRMAELLGPHQNEFGPIRGGGYPNAATAAFLRQYVGRYGCLPDGVRRSWSWQVLRDLDAAALAPATSEETRR